MDSELKTEEQEKLVAEIKDILSQVGAEIGSAKDWGKKEFAYPINKKREGFYWLFSFSCLSSKIGDLKQKLQLKNKIVRYLLTEVG